MAQTDRTTGLVGETGMKVPVRAATTAAITLSGEQTIDGVACVTGDRVLVKNQVDTTTNGIYVVDTGSWTRSLDCDGTYDLKDGSLIQVSRGTANSRLVFVQTTADPIVIGTTSLVFQAINPGTPITTPLALASGGTGQITKATAAAALGVVSLTGAAGTANAQTAAAPSNYTAFTANDIFEYTPPVTNTGATTVTITPSGGGALAAQNVLWNNAALNGGELVISDRVLLMSDGAGNLHIVGNSSFLPMLRDLYAGDPGGRLTLTTAVPVTVADVTAATSVFYTPYKHSTAKIYNGANWVPYIFSELTLGLDSNAGHTNYHQSGKNFDVFLYNDVGTLRIGTGPAWTGDTARGAGAGTTELQLLNGRQTNKNAITLRFGNASGNTTAVAANQATYLGSFRTSADGQTQDAETARWVWNNYNRAPRPAKNPTETTDSWTYTVLTYRQANNNAANQLDVLRGLDEDTLYATVTATQSNDTLGTAVGVGIGIDSSTVNSAKHFEKNTTAVANQISCALHAIYDGYPGLGRHTVRWLEISAAVGNTTWVGDAGGTLLQTGISGRVFA